MGESQTPILRTENAPQTQASTQNSEASILSDQATDTGISTVVSDNPAKPNSETTAQDQDTSALDSISAADVSDTLSITDTETSLPDDSTVDIEDSTVTGAPGASVDCAKTLPCRWISSDSQFEVTITSSDNIGAQGRLKIEYAIYTSHDTELHTASADPIVDDTGTNLEPAALSIGADNGRSVLSVLAGTTTEARIEFSESSNAESLVNWTIGLSDAGLIRQPDFNNIPIGDSTELQIDCAGLLPCVWDSPDGNVAITLLSTSNSGSINQLTVNFKIETLMKTDVAINAGSFAIDTDGLEYKGRTHGYGAETSGEEVSATAFAGALVAGNVYFYRTQTVSDMLQLLSLVVYEDKPVPRWNPEFLSVPVR